MSDDGRPRPGGRRWQGHDPPPPAPGEPRRPGDPVPLRDALDRFLAGLGAPPADALAAVFERWHELAGSPLADHAAPAALERGTLTLVVDDPGWASEARYRAAALRRRCDEVLGEGAVRVVEVRVRRR